MSGWVYEYYRGRLSGREHKAYVQVYQGWADRKQIVAITGSPLETDELHRVITAVAYDHPELFWVDYYAVSLLQTGLLGQLTVKQLFSEPERQWLEEQCIQWRQYVLDDMPIKISVPGKIWTLYDYLARQITYIERGTALSHTIAGPASERHRSAVCEGIAKSFKYMCDALHIPCIYVTGSWSGGGHAWNIVRCGNVFRHVDVTAELQSAKFFGKASRKKFLRTDRQMSRYQWDTGAFPSCV